MQVNQILCGDNVELSKQLDGECIQLCVTSPPYGNLKNYNGFTWSFEGIADELFRVIKPGGVVVWVVGDACINGSESLESFRQALYFQEIGFNCHDTMIYQKLNFSNPSTNRYHQIFEYMMVFSKGKPKTFNPILDKKNKNLKYKGKNTTKQPDGSVRERKWGKQREFGMRGNVWVMKTAGQENAYKKLKHPAMFPAALAYNHILSWSNPGDLVFDPFCGSGTVCIQANLLGRKYLGFDISKEYCELARERIEGEKVSNLEY